MCVYFPVVELSQAFVTGVDLGGGCRGCAPPPPLDDLRFSNTTGSLCTDVSSSLRKKSGEGTTGILPKKKKTMWFIGVEVEQETIAPPPKKNPGSAPV